MSQLQTATALTSYPVPDPVLPASAGQSIAGYKFYGHGIFAKKDPKVQEVIYVAVTRTDVTKGLSAWHEPADGDEGIIWKALTDDFGDNRFPRHKGGWELVVCKNATDDKKRVARYVNLDGVHSYNITFKDFGEQLELQTVTPKKDSITQVSVQQPSPPAPAPGAPIGTAPQTTPSELPPRVQAGNSSESQDASSTTV